MRYSTHQGDGPVGAAVNALAVGVLTVGACSGGARSFPTRNAPRTSVECGWMPPGGASVSTTDQEAVQSMCEHIARLIATDDREQWLGMADADLAVPGGVDALREALRNSSLPNVLELPPERFSSVTVAHDCSLCRRSYVTYGFDNSPWRVVVEDGRIVWMGRCGSPNLDCQPQHPAPTIDGRARE